MTTDQIICTEDGSSGKIIFNNPQRHNAMSLEMWRDGTKAIQDLCSSDKIRCISLKGAGDKAFVAGADISKFGKERNSKDAIEEYNDSVRTFQETLIKVPIPTIAEINGYCIGGGLAIALCCDIRIAANNSRFAVPAAKLGLGYAANGIERLMQIVGPSFAMEIFYTARQFSSEEALTMGLVNRVLNNSELTEYCDNYVNIIANNAPLTIKAVKAAVNENLKSYSDRILELCDEMVTACFNSKDYIEGQAAFMEKRKPVFTGT